MASRRGRDKEVTAVTHNLKQQKMMEKTMHTLSLEESYAMKLLEINRRIVQVNYSRMTDKVAQINSFLTPEEIKILNEMEATGNLTSMYSSPNFSPSIRIDSAEKRLKLNTPRPKTAIPYDTPREEMFSSRREKRPVTSHRRRSLTNDFQSDSEEAGHRHHSHSKRHIRPKTAFVHATPTSQSGETGDVPKHSRHGKARPATAVHRQTSDPGAPNSPRKERAKTAPSSSNKTQNQYNCHDSPNPEVRTLASAMGGTPRSRSSIEFSKTAIENAKASNNFQERKMEMLKMEAQRGLELDSKKNSFLKKVGEHVRTKPTPVTRRLSARTPSASELDIHGMESVPSSNTRRSRKKHVTGKTSDEDYRQRVEDSWKDLKKCRYLRLPDNDNDVEVSTEGTLVKDNLKLLDIFKRKNQKSFLKGLQLND